MIRIESYLADTKSLNGLRSGTPLTPPATMKRIGRPGQSFTCAFAPRRVGNESAASNKATIRFVAEQSDVSDQCRRAWPVMEYSKRRIALQPVVEADRAADPAGGNVDKFRALEYLVASADAKSFSGAARRLKVSVTAVANMVAALEAQLGVLLVERSSTGLVLTGAGSGYVDSCRLLLQRLAEADEQASAALSRIKGTVVLGIQHVIARECLTPAIPRFHAMYPDIHLDVRDFSRLSDTETSGIDVFVVLGWPQADNLVQRRVGAARFAVLASPTYWSTHGVPQRPSDLGKHTCFLVRAIDGTAMDLWTFERAGVRESVAVSGWLVTSNAQRDMAMDLAMGGEGVVRVLDWTSRPEVAAGTLVPVLTDWQSPEAPPVNLLYRASVRRIPRVRLLIDFVIETLEAKTTGISGPVTATDRPAWMNRRLGRASVINDLRR